jgi:hypothetical protein
MFAAVVLSAIASIVAACAIAPWFDAQAILREAAESISPD